MARLKLKLLLFSTFGILAVMFIRVTDYQLKTHFEKKVLTMVDRFILNDMKLNNTSEPPVNATLLHTSVSTQATTKTTHLLRNTSNSFTKRTNTTTNPIPEWVQKLQTFHVPKVPFNKVKTPIVFYSYYRSSFFSKCLESLALSANDIDESTPCIFLLYRTKVGTEKNVSGTLQAIERVNFCKTFVWQINKDEPPAVLSAANYKVIWWKTIKMMFKREGNFSTILKDWNGEELLVLEEDIILSPDFIKAYWFGSRIFRTVASRDLFVAGVALGGYSGENIINAHPDTFVVRRAFHFQAMAYTVSDRLYEYLTENEELWVNNDIADFSESIGALYRRKERLLLMVVPTLARMWHIGSWGMGWNGKGTSRDVQRKPSWVDVMHNIDLENAVVNVGVRDMYGFLCKFMGSESNCDDWWPKKRTMPNMFRLWCVKQPFVFDRCLVPET